MDNERSPVFRTVYPCKASYELDRLQRRLEPMRPTSSFSELQQIRQHSQEPLGAECSDEVGTRLAGASSHETTIICPSPPASNDGDCTVDEQLAFDWRWTQAMPKAVCASACEERECSCGDEPTVTNIHGTLSSRNTLDVLLDFALQEFGACAEAGVHLEARIGRVRVLSNCLRNILVRLSMDQQREWCELMKAISLRIVR
jgi:hypothetical protein